MARILLSAYACEPDRGSEPAVGWNWATELARMGHEVSVVTRTANQKAIETNGRNARGVNFIYYDLPAWVQRLRRYPLGKQLYYVLWQWFAARMLRGQSASTRFDLVQHVTYVSVRFPSFMGSLGIPFYLGPVSGGEAVPPALRPGFSAGQRCREGLRDLSNWVVAYDPFLRWTLRQARRIFVTPDTLSLLPRCVRHKAVETLAIGLSQQAGNTVPLTWQSSPSGLRLLYAGRLLEWKGVDIALRALKLIRDAIPQATLTIVGDGPAKSRLVELCRHLQLDGAVKWCGWTSQREVFGHYRASTLLLFPSLRDSGGMVVLEALANGLPVIATDRGGPGLIVNGSCGRAIRTRNQNHEELARDMAKAVQEILETPGELESLRRGAETSARAFSFEALVRSVHPQIQPMVRRA